MRGIITKSGKKAKIDISGRAIYRVNKDTLIPEWVDEGDAGGNCDICQLHFSTVMELIDHFKEVHREGETV